MDHRWHLGVQTMGNSKQLCHINPTSMFKSTPAPSQCDRVQKIWWECKPDKFIHSSKIKPTNSLVTVFFPSTLLPSNKGIS